MRFSAEQIQTATGGRWIQQPPRAASINGIGIDSRGDLSGKAFVAVRGANHDGHEFIEQAAAAGAVLIIAEKLLTQTQVSTDIGVLEVPDTREALLRIASAWREQLALTRIIAVTGSSGKTTTRNLIHAILSAKLRGTQSPKSFNNVIGVPMTLFGIDPADDFAVVEVGTNMPGEIVRLAANVRPDIAVITSIGHAHLQGLGDLRGVAREKASLVKHLGAGGVAIVNRDSPEIRGAMPAVPRTVSFGRAGNASYQLTDRGSGSESDRWWFEINGTRRFEVKLPGAHNAMNAIAAIAVADQFGLGDLQIQQGLDAMQPARMRLNIQRIGAVTVCNDAYNANPDSMKAALDTFVEISADASPRVLVLGDMLELGEHAGEMHRSLGRFIRDLDQRHPLAMVILVGRLVVETAGVLAGSSLSSRMMHIPEISDDSAAEIASMLKPGAWVLLKASRGMALERILPGISALFDSDAGQRLDRVRAAKAPEADREDLLAAQMRN